ncbi:MAG TPA: hypothetical protein DDY70_03200 [Clostridiales bacterium]|nr:hypothetical protein [Clostridiales bacterium]
MKRSRLLFSLFFSLLILTLFIFCACAPAGDGGNTDNGEKTYRVMVTVPEGATVVGKNPVEVKAGESATFRITVGKEYVVTGVSDGTFDPATGTLTVTNVREKKNITLSLLHVGYDTTVKYAYFFHGTDEDTTSEDSGQQLFAGTEITVRAGDTGRLFTGWSFSKLGADPSVIVSTEREYTFRLSPDLASGGKVDLYANYADTNRLYYDANGGTVNRGTKNMTTSDYYTTSVSGSSVLVTLKQKYLDYCECASAFWDDGTFRRDGYLLKEYNTKPDGSGESYSPGSKVYHVTGDGSYLTLYCIWEKCADAGVFSVADTTYAAPSGVNPNYIPEWSERGVKITGYTGTLDTLAIPETIGGKKVIGIAAGAFRNASFTTLLLPRTLEFIEDGAFIGCSSLTTLYFPDSIYSVKNAAFDAATYENFRHFIVNATMAPRLSDTEWGSMSLKLSRLLASMDQNRIVIVAGSSSYQGLGTAYLERLLDNRYRVVNFGTARTMNGVFLLEAMRHFVHTGDTVLYAPENSAYMMGERELYWKTVYLTEGMYNLWRYVDISAYTNLFDAFTDYNQNYRYNRAPTSYEAIVNRSSRMNKYGDYLSPDRAHYCGEAGAPKYYDTYYVTMNERYKSKDEGNWKDEANQEANKDYTDPNNKTWATITDPYYADSMNRAIRLVRATGAKVYFSFCPVDADKLVDEARSAAHFAAYDAMIAENFAFDGVLGSSLDYVMAHKYFYDNAFHPNDYGRTYRTYRLYLDLCAALGASPAYGLRDVGTTFEGCLFETGEMTPAGIS